ncbi:hypothetical protein [Cellulophaga baltica]|uniref:hypothetical protein n=1 Tax=Cellulophaga baltica TaxID=76594 RepID=UPI0024946C33|nr:hypothetical protein [Cellulophaga baltica]
MKKSILFLIILVGLPQLAIAQQHKTHTTTSIVWNSNKISKEYRNNLLKEPISVKIEDKKKEVKKDEFYLDLTFSIAT